MRVLAEIIASDGNHPIEPVLWDSLLPSDCSGSVHQLRDEGDQERHITRDDLRQHAHGGADV